MARLNWWRPIDHIGCKLLGPGFVGGCSIEEVLRTGAELKRLGYKVTYNLLGEHARDLRTISLALETTLDLIRRMDDSNFGNIAIKPTLYGLELGKEEFYKQAQVLVEAAMAKGIETEFDAERRSTTEDAFDVFGRFAKRFPQRNFVRQCVQAHFRTDELMKLMARHELWDKQLRIVKGSGVYDEEAACAAQNDEDIQFRYLGLLLLINYSVMGQLPYVATVRDRRLAELAKEIKPRSYIRPYKFDFQTLYGPLGKKLRAELLAEGWPVRIYIPFVADWCKDEWKAYGLRRAAFIRRLIFSDLEVGKAILKEIIDRIKN